MSHFVTLVIGENVKEQLAPYQENNMGDCPKQFLQFVLDEDADLDGETGKRGYWENPNRKWDYWLVGGRYAMRLKVKPGAQGHREPAKFVDQARAGDIDWEGMRAKRLANRAQWWDEAASRPEGVHSMVYGIELEMTREQYIAKGEEFSVFAVVKDGRWYERGKMGWWGVVSNEKNKEVWGAEMKKLLDGLPPESLLTIVDCHI